MAALLGGGTAESVHAGRAAIRPLSTATTAGAGNPVRSLLEEAVIGLLVAIFLAWRRLRRSRAAAREAPI